ncbi:MAG: hypothetical protein WC400_02030 [Patescibacteria group bacterium]|jgi:hypothetical protein
MPENSFDTPGDDEWSQDQSFNEPLNASGTVPSIPKSPNPAEFKRIVSKKAQQAIDSWLARVLWVGILVAFVMLSIDIWRNNDAYRRYVDMYQKYIDRTDQIIYDYDDFRDQLINMQSEIQSLKTKG